MQRYSARYTRVENRRTFFFPSVRSALREIASSFTKHPWNVHVFVGGCVRVFVCLCTHTHTPNSRNKIKECNTSSIPEMQRCRKNDWNAVSRTLQMRGRSKQKKRTRSHSMGWQLKNNVLFCRFFHPFASSQLPRSTNRTTERDL